MKTLAERVTKRVKPFEIANYCMGDATTSLLMNAVNAFLMMYYTDTLGLSYSKAGFAMAIATLWDAVTDPIMGHVTDNTRSRFGRRHPYILLGGLSMIVCFYMLWSFPSFIGKDPGVLFMYLLVVNLLMRTTFTIFYVPYIALGFEICTDYDQRSTLQGFRNVFAMGANLLGPAMAWAIFFKDIPDSDIKPTHIASNFLNMSTVFSIVAIAMVLYVVISTRKHIIDSRNLKGEMEGGRISDFFRDMKEIFCDRNPKWVFLFTFFVILGASTVSVVQMYIYVHFMDFTAVQKTWVHGGTMVGCMMGSLMLPWISRRLDKKSTVFFAVTLSVFANFCLAIVFLTGYVKPGAELSFSGMIIPVAMILFLIFQLVYWLGNGIMMPLTNSMMADVSEVNKLKTGVLKDGAYAAVLSFVFKAAQSAGFLISGKMMEVSGFIAGENVQSPKAVWNLALIMFIVAPAISLASMFIMIGYPINRKVMEDVKMQLAQKEGLTGNE